MDFHRSYAFWQFILSALTFVIGFLLPYHFDKPAEDSNLVFNFTPTSINNTTLLYSSSPLVPSFGSWHHLEEVQDTLNTSAKTEAPEVYVITPTYSRNRQLHVPLLVRTAQAMYSARAFVSWTLVIDQDHQRNEKKLNSDGQIPLSIVRLLEPFNISFTVHRTPETRKKVKLNSKKRTKGLAGRLQALRILRAKAKGKEGVVFFADDDNAYDSQLFHEIRNTRTVSMWPVGCLTKHGLGTPVINTTSSCNASNSGHSPRVLALYDSWIGGRTFPVDFAGFAVNLRLFMKHWNTSTDDPIEATPTRQEDSLLKSLSLQLEDVLPLPVGGNCTQILSWHTRERSRSSYVIK